MQDAFGRTISYLRLSVTDRCDFRCWYCLPRSHRDFAKQRDWLQADEIERLVTIFAQLGVRHVRLTGGEPLTRRDIVDISGRVRRVPGIDELSLSSNASQLARLAAPLAASGVSRLNISLDTLNPQRFFELTGGELAPVLAGIEAARDAGFSLIKINMVMLRDVNDDELVPMVEYCRERGLALRFIETMPIGSGGIEANQHYISLKVIEERLHHHYRLQPAAIRGSGPARYLQVEDSDLVVGFITPQSQHFCDKCNRIRLSAIGALHLCLNSENPLSLRDMVRGGADDLAIKAAILKSMAFKPERHTFDQPETHTIRPMSALGG
ncbi:MAG: GTP 3',8-cyclase MoaA [Gammaproteobacteria bacterium]|nr:GTP 3',8-cyclase MoaA [Gammaproteobacteria bacterium]